MENNIYLNPNMTLDNFIELSNNSILKDLENNDNILFNELSLITEAFDIKKIGSSIKKFAENLWRIIKTAFIKFWKIIKGIFSKKQRMRNKYESDVKKGYKVLQDLFNK